MLKENYKNIKLKNLFVINKQLVIINLNMSLKEYYPKIIVPLCSFIPRASLYPLDVIKNHYQIYSNSQNIKGYNVENINNNNLKFIIKNIYQNEGIKGFYKGIKFQTLTYPTFWTTFFYLNSKKREITKYKFLDNFIWTTFSSSVGSLIANPFYVIDNKYKTSLVTNNYNNNSFIFLSKEIYMKEGCIGFLKGYKTNLVNNASLLIQMPVYYKLNENFNPFISGMISKTFTSCLFYPFDMIKNLQRSSLQNPSMLECFKSIYLNKGIKGFYNGIHIHAPLSILNFSFMIYLTDKFTPFLKKD